MKRQVTTLLTTILLSGSLLAEPVAFKQEPQQPPATVKLSDGRIVPFGSGAICSEECAQTSVPADERHSRRWVVPVAIGAVAVTAFLAFLPRHCPPTMTGNPTPVPGLTPTPQPGSPVPEQSTIVLLVLGLAFISRNLWNRKSNSEWR